MRVGQKKIFHLEAWVVKTMSLIKVSGARSFLGLYRGCLGVITNVHDAEPVLWFRYQRRF
jgi:hypothetical protein